MNSIMNSDSPEITCVIVRRSFSVLASRTTDINKTVNFVCMASINGQGNGWTAVCSHGTSFPNEWEWTINTAGGRSRDTGKRPHGSLHCQYYRLAQWSCCNVSRHLHHLSSNRLSQWGVQRGLQPGVHSTQGRDPVLQPKWDVSSLQGTACTLGNVEQQALWVM